MKSGLASAGVNVSSKKLNTPCPRLMLGSSWSGLISSVGGPEAFTSESPVVNVVSESGIPNDST